MKKRRGAGELTLLDKALDAAIRRVTLARDGNRCCWCGGTKRLNTAHVIPKRKGHTLRWDIRNVLQLCYRCHLERWHKDPLEAAAWFAATYPDRLAYLEEHRNDYREYSVEDKEKLLRYLDRMEREWQKRNTNRSTVTSGS